MLGFTALSETPISQATSFTLALAYLSSAGSILYAEDVLYNALAYVTSPSATSSFTANTLLFDAKALRSISGATSATAINNVAYDAKANITPNAATSSFTAGTLDFNALAYITITSAIADILNGGIEYDAKASITTSAVTTAIATSALDYDAQANYYITTLLATFVLTLDEPTAVTFDYQQYADSYDRHRALYLLADNKNKTILLPIQPTPTSYTTVHDNKYTITLPERESSIIYLGAQDTNRTVKIAA
jgi:hypothetical protein